MIHGLDDWIAGLGGGSPALALVAALLLGLRHATDPDHVAAVSTLVLSREGSGRARAGLLGLAWGSGHAATVLAMGVPVVYVGRLLPDAVRTTAEVAVGLLVVALAVRLLVRWRRGRLHAHPHRHGDVLHAHPHLHEDGGLARRRDAAGGHGVGAGGDADGGPREGRHGAGAAHGHAHDGSLGRSPRESFGIGLVHGVGGSAGAGVLLVASVDDPARGLLALALFAAGTAVSMTVLSALVGRLVDRRSVAGRTERLVPAFGAASFLFGLWYALGALELVPYVF